MDDATFLAVERLNNPKRVEATEAGWNPCPCPTCDRLRRIFAAPTVTPNTGDSLTVEKLLAAKAAVEAEWGEDGWGAEPQRIDIPLEPGASPQGIADFFRAMGFNVVEITDERPVEFSSAPDFSHTVSDFTRRAEDLAEAGDETDQGDFIVLPADEYGQLKADFEAMQKLSAFDNDPLAGLSSDQRKCLPIGTGVLDYFPDAIAAVAAVSFYSNEKHNPGEPLHWNRAKSGDEADALQRHFLARGGWDTVGGVKVRHSAMLAWRSLALLQKEIEAEKDEDGDWISRGSTHE